MYLFHFTIYFFHTRLRACSKSAIKSSASSKPTEILIKLSVIPSLSRSSFGTASCDVRALKNMSQSGSELFGTHHMCMYTYGISIKLWIAPKLAPVVNIFSAFKNVLDSAKPPLI